VDLSVTVCIQKSFCEVLPAGQRCVGVLCVEASTLSYCCCCSTGARHGNEIDVHGTVQITCTFDTSCYYSIYQMHNSINSALLVERYVTYAHLLS